MSDIPIHDITLPLSKEWKTEIHRVDIADVKYIIYNEARANA